MDNEKSLNIDESRYQTMKKRMESKTISDMVKTMKNEPEKQTSKSEKKEDDGGHSTKGRLELKQVKN